MHIVRSINIEEELLSRQDHNSIVTMQWIVVTGANSGIGLASVKYLVQRNEDFNIIATARKQEDIDNLQQLNRVDATYLDVTDSESIDTFVAYLDQKSIGVDVLVNNAGILQFDLMMNMTIAEIKNLFETNVFGVFQLCKALFPQLQANGGKIINISSDNGLVTVPYTTAYSMSKYAIEAFTEGLREEIREYNISVTMVEPGNIGTSIVKKALQNMRYKRKDPLLKDQYEKLKKITEETTSEFDTNRSPEIVAKRVYEIILEKEPKTRYFEGTAAETKYVIQELFEKVGEINSTSQYGLTSEELRSEFEFMLNLYKDE